MAGRPQKKQIAAAVDRRVRNRYADDDGATGLETAVDFACDWIASGGTLTRLAAELSLELGFDVNRERLSIYLHSLDEECEARFARARTRGAHGLAEQAVEIVDEPALDSVDVSRNRSRAGARQWTAGKWNRAEFGEQSQAVNVAISLNTLSLDAMRAPLPTATARVIESGELATGDNGLAALGL